MKLKIVYPKWPKLPHQPEFHLPPHGPVVFAATDLPPGLAAPDLEQKLRGWCNGASGMSVLSRASTAASRLRPVSVTPTVCVLPSTPASV